MEADGRRDGAFVTLKMSAMRYAALQPSSVLWVVEGVGGGFLLKMGGGSLNTRIHCILMYPNVFCMYVACILRIQRIQRNTSEYILDTRRIQIINCILINPCVDTDVPQIHLQTHPEYIRNTPGLNLNTTEYNRIQVA